MTNVGKHKWYLAIHRSLRSLSADNTILQKACKKVIQLNTKGVEGKKD